MVPANRLRDEDVSNSTGSAGSQNSRRDFLRQAVGSATAVFASGCSPEPSTTDFDVIDVHIHADFGDRTLANQGHEISGVDFSPAGLAAEMAANRVIHACAMGWETGRTGISREARNPMFNSPPTQLAGKLSLIAGINPYTLDAEALARIDSALAAGTLKGLKIYLGYYPVAPDDDRYKPLYDLAGRRGVPVVFHTGDTSSADAKVRFAHPLPIDDIAVDFRQTKFVLAHLGNPWTMDAAELIYKNPNVYADLSGFLIGPESYFSDPKNAEGINDALERIREAFAWVENPKKFLYGSDWPLAPVKPYLALMKRAIHPRHHEAVFRTNAADVFAVQV
jgi:hypothetical protein